MNQSTQKNIVIVVSGLALLVGLKVVDFLERKNPSSVLQGTVTEIHAPPPSGLSVKANIRLREKPEQADSGTAPYPEERLKPIIEGYETVLQREPNNATAKQGLQQSLESLVVIQKQAGNLEGAIATMEKLAALFPDNERYQQVLQQLKEDQKQPQPQPSPADVVILEAIERLRNLN